MTKFKRIINGECHFEMIELFDDVEKASNTQNRGELIECNIDNLRFDFTKVKKEHDDNKLKAESYNLHIKVNECREQLMTK